MAYSTEQIRNLALGGHSGAGKTSVAEAMLFNFGLTNRLGRIADGTTVSDYDKEEIARQISLKATLLNGEWKSHHLNVVDTPGYADFIAEAKGALRVADGAVAVVDAAAGVEIGTERVWRFAEEYGLPRLLMVNKLDRADLDVDEVLETIRERFGRQAIQLQLPLNPGEGFSQIVDLVEMKLLTSEDGSTQVADLPDELAEAAQELREHLVEAVAETDEELMERYFSEGELTSEELSLGLRQAVGRQEVFPICFGDAYNNVGIEALLDLLVDYFPSPEESSGLRVPDGDGDEMVLEAKTEAPLAALVFKTLAEQHVGDLTLLRLYAGGLKSGVEAHNPVRNATERIGQIFHLNGHERTEVEEAQAGDFVALVKLRSTRTGDTLCARGAELALPGIEFPQPLIRVAVAPTERGGEERMATGLAQLRDEDPSFTFGYDGQVRQSLLAVQGELHLATIVQRLTQQFGVAVDIATPRIPYLETIKGNSEGHHRHKKQTGGRGQFGEVFLRVSSRGRGEGFDFSSQVVGGNIPTNFIPAIEKGIVETLPEGPVSGYSVADVAVVVYDGKHHPVDSDEVSFKLAGAMAFKQAFLNSKPVLLEPIYALSVTVPEEYMGDVMGDISSRRGRIAGMDTDGHFQIIRAEVPLSELDRYATSLRSMTQGKGLHTEQLERYEEVPHEIMEKIVAEAKREKEEA